MAEVEEMAIENLKEWIFDENKIVTFKWLSLMLSMHVNQSKRILETFVELNENKPGCELSVVYCVSGLVKDGDFEVYKVELVTEESYKKVKAMFIPPVSCHVYSVQRSALRNLANLYIADYDLIKENIFSSNKFSAIHCAAARMRTPSSEVPLKPLDEVMTSFVAIKKEEKGKPHASTKGVSSFFGKQTRKTADSSNSMSCVETPRPAISDQSKRTANGSLCDQNNLANGNASAARSSHMENEKVKRQQVAEKEDQRTGRRKRLRIAETSSSEEDEKEEEDTRIEMAEEMNCKDEEVKDMAVADAGEPVSATADASQKKTTKKLVSKTYVNDEGFMVTEKVWETSEVMEVLEEKAAPVQKPASVPAQPLTMPKKKMQPQKGNKQTLLMKFFNKQ